MTLSRVWIASSVVAVLGLACAKVPYSGRRQLNIIPSGVMRGIGKTSYASTLQGSQLVRRGEDANLLTQVGRRISAVANQPKFRWDYTLIDGADANAWCLPGGFIGFYTGILPALQNEAGMAFVMGHEVGHATAHHGAERLSQQLAVLGGVGALTAYTSQATSMTPAQVATISAAVGLGVEVGVLLPFSRKHESEADLIGMMYAASAGYPPAEGIALWDRMEALSGGGSGPAFLSTHPSNARRKARMREWLPRAQKRYERNALSHDTLAQRWTASAAPRPTQGRGETGRTPSPRPTGDRSGGAGGSGDMQRPR